jgi:hypothetical protein
MDFFFPKKKGGKKKKRKNGDKFKYDVHFKWLQKLFLNNIIFEIHI